MSGGKIEGKYDNFQIIYEGRNYLEGMNKDTAFLMTSNYAKLFNICRKNDPFLVSIASKRITQSEQANDLIELPIPTSLIKRIKIADEILLKEIGRAHV